jgi:hypothetical protein
MRALLRRLGYALFERLTQIDLLLYIKRLLSVPRAVSTQLRTLWM